MCWQGTLQWLSTPQAWHCVWWSEWQKTASNMQLIPGTKFFQIVSFLEPAPDLGCPCNKVPSLAFQSASSVGEKGVELNHEDCLQVYCRPPYAPITLGTPIRTAHTSEFRIGNGLRTAAGDCQSTESQKVTTTSSLIRLLLRKLFKICWKAPWLFLGNFWPILKACYIKEKFPYLVEWCILFEFALPWQGVLWTVVVPVALNCNHFRVSLTIL